MTPRLEVNLRLCTRDMETVKKQKNSDSLWTKFGPCHKGLKPSEYATDTKGIMKKVIRDVSDHHSKNGVFETYSGQNSLCLVKRYT